MTEKPPRPQDKRQEQLARALRENLKRRKAQAQARRNGEPPPRDPPPKRS